MRQKLLDIQPPPSLEPESARFRLFDSITTFLKSASRHQPLALILDNLHWADRSSLLLLEFLAPELEDSHLLVVGTYRDVELSRGHPLAQTLGELTRERLFQRVLLHGLTQEDVGRYMKIASQATPDPELVSTIYVQSEGNPLFVTEIVRLLEQEGCALGGRIPDGIREVIGRRLDRLSEECNRALTAASVIGREFGFEPLHKLTDGLTEDRLLEALEEALGSGVIEEVKGEIGRYQFSHALIRQTLASELSTTRRVRLHARIAETLEVLYSKEADAHAVELAYNFGEAQTVLGTEELMRYSILAGKRTLAIYAYEEALRHFERALIAKEGQPASTSSAELGMRPLQEKVIALKERAEDVGTTRQLVQYPDGLTEREVEVLRLVAAGRSNREIADELFISLRTVANHMTNILNKIDAANRAEAASYATRHSLV